MSWAEAARALRKAQGWTLAEAAETSHGALNIGTLGNIERGRHENPTDSLQQRLARLYGLTVEQLRREAGLSEPAPDLTELPDVLIRSINSLPPEDRTKVLDYVRLLQTAAQEKERRRAKVQRDSSQAVEPAEPDQPSQNGRISARVPRLRRAQL